MAGKKWRVPVNHRPKIIVYFDPRTGHGVKMAKRD